MKIVIQCAASKERTGGFFLTSAGKPVKFLAHPEKAPTDSTYLFARPDDFAETNRTWRDLVGQYNATTNANPFGLLPAYRLYSNPAYSALVDKFGIDNVYILSAGWGLIRADFLTPQYDITFSMAAEPFKRRKRNDRYDDFRQLTSNTADQIVFFGGKDYLPLFCRVTSDTRSERIIFYNAMKTPSVPNCCLIKYETAMRTNWHYACATDFLAQRITI